MSPGSHRLAVNPGEPQALYTGPGSFYAPGPVSISCCINTVPRSVLGQQQQRLRCHTEPAGRGHMGIQLQKAQKPMASLSKAVPLASAIPVAHLSPSCTQVWQVTDTQAKHVAAKLYIVRKEFSLFSSPSGRKQEDTDPGESIRAARWVAPGSLRLCVCGGRPAAVGPCVSRKNRQQESPLRAAGRLACYGTTWLTATPYKDSVSEGVTYFDFSKQPRMAAAPPHLYLGKPRLMEEKLLTHSRPHVVGTGT